MAGNRVEAESFDSSVNNDLSGSNSLIKADLSSFPLSLGFHEHWPEYQTDGEQVDT